MWWFMGRRLWCFAWKHFSMHPPKTYAEVVEWERKGYLL